MMHESGLLILRVQCASPQRFVLLMRWCHEKYVPMDEGEGSKFTNLKEIYETTQPPPPTQNTRMQESNQSQSASPSNVSDSMDNWPVALIQNTRMQESKQSKPASPSNVSDSMDDWVRICDTCGDTGYESLLVSCNTCSDGAAHTYCMRVMLFEKPDYWMCEECAPMAGTDKLVQDEVKAASRTSKGHLSKRSINLESSKGANKSTIGVSSTDQEKEKVPRAQPTELPTHLSKDGSLENHEARINAAFDDDRNRKDPITVSISVTSDRVVSEESNDISSMVLLADACELDNHAMCLISSDSGVTAENNEKETISASKTLLSGSNLCNLDVVGSSGQLSHRLPPSIHTDSISINEKKKNVSHQVQHPAKASADMSMFKLYNGSSSDGMSNLRDSVQIEAGTLSQGFVIPTINHSWLGKFLIHNSEGIERTCDGFQAHLSSCASSKVHEVVDKLPEIIILEELPRLGIWPSQFMRSQVTEENIALYFFPNDVHSYDIYYRGLVNHMTNNDLALKGNLDEVELLIFPSNILPERSQRWNQMMFLWGVFKAQKVNNTANTTVSNSLKQGSGDIVKRREIDLNAYPEDEDDDNTCMC